MISDHLKQWNGIPIVQFKPGDSIDSAKIPRICFDWDDESVSGKGLLQKFLENPRAGEVVGLSLGLSSDSADSFYSEMAKPLLEAKDRFPNLKFLFLGEMIGEESELTWIGQGDVGSPFLDAWPGLEELRARGGLDYGSDDGDGALSFSRTRHICLKKLVIETGGLAKAALEGIRNSVLPELEHLEIWLGTDERGADTTIEDIKPFLHDNPFPKLKYLGLKNSELADEIATEVANALVLDQLETLDLSLGTMRDAGGAALVGSEKIKGLKKLILNHHFMSDNMMDQVEALGIETEVGDQEVAEEYDGETYYYVAVSE